MAAMAWMTSDPDTLPFLALRSRALPPKGFNSGWYRNPALDELLVAARGESDPRARAAIYARVQRIVHDDAPWLFVASWKQNVVAQSAVQGLKLEPSFQLHLEGVHKQ
jgi:peptide/nickel transport system substrate-binding protein